MRMRKKEKIRRQILDLRSQLTEEERTKAALAITSEVMKHQWFDKSKIVLGFAGYGSEIDTRGILQECLRLQKEVYMPKVCGEEICFFRIASLEDLTEGYKGIPEPKGDTQMYLYSEEIAEETLMLMPGVAFDVNRHRIGYGKGFYDRYLADKSELQFRTIGIGFWCQLVIKIPSNKNDIRPRQILCV